MAFGPDRGLVLGVDDRAGVDPDALARIVAAPAFEITRDVPDGDALGLWLALHDPAYCHRSDDRPEPLLTESPRFVFTGARYRFTMGLLEGDALCLIVCPADAARRDGLRIRCYDADPDAARCLGARCRAHLKVARRGPANARDVALAGLSVGYGAAAAIAGDDREAVARAGDRLEGVALRASGMKTAYRSAATRGGRG